MAIATQGVSCLARRWASALIWRAGTVWTFVRCRPSHALMLFAGSPSMCMDYILCCMHQSSVAPLFKLQLLPVDRHGCADVMAVLLWHIAVTDEFCVLDRAAAAAACSTPVAPCSPQLGCWWSVAFEVCGGLLHDCPPAVGYTSGVGGCCISSGRSLWLGTCQFCCVLGPSRLAGCLPGSVWCCCCTCCFFFK